jgi:hypothetical protein
MIPLLVVLSIFTGHWSGGVRAGGWYPLEIDFDAATIAGQKLGAVRIDGNRIHFEWAEEGGELAIFDGTLSGDTMEGVFVQGALRGRFWFARTARVPPPQTGLYRKPDGALLWIGRVSELSRQPGFIEPATGRLAMLYPRSENEWFSRGGERIRFDRLRRVDCCVEEEVTWRNGATVLHGTLVKPKQVRGKVPAVVMLHGSGGAKRSYFSSLPYLLAHAGIASLVYDKRAERHKATFYDLADDAIRGAQMLEARGDVGPFGVFGHSQGG